MTSPQVIDQTPRVGRHRFAPDVESGLAELRKLDDWHGPLALVEDWAVIIAVAWVAELVTGPWWWAFYLVVALPIIGSRQRAFATLLHESAHGTLARNKRLNTFLGTVPSAHLILQTRRAYRRSHLRDHHGSFGDPAVDPDLRAHVDAGLYRPRSGRSFVWVYLIAPLSGWRTPLLLKELLTSRLSGTRDEVLGSIGVVGYFAAVWAAFAAAGHADLFLWYWAVPLFTTFPLVNWYIELLEHFPLVGDESVDVLTTRHRAVGPVSRHVLGIHAEGFHLDHHLSPKIPFWNLRAAHDLRMTDPVYRAAVFATCPAGKGLLWQFADMTRRVGEGRTTGRIGVQPGRNR